MNISQDVLAQFNHLEKSGALDQLGELRRENRELERIITDAAMLVSYTDVNSMLDFIISKLLDHFIPQFLGFIVLPPRGRGIRQFCFRNLKPSDDVIDPLYYEIFRERFNKNPMYARFEEIAEELGPDLFGKDFHNLQPERIFPMFGIGGLYGIVIMGKKLIGDSYSELEEKYVDRMIRFLSVSIQNGLHYESSITDPKTGLFTHDFFVRRLDEAIAHTYRRNSTAGVLLMDVDHFKRFNDNWGHVMGDEALIALAGVLQKSIRGEDCAARFGGEEFSVLVAECNESKLMKVAERIRIAVSEIRIPYPPTGTDLTLTISIGARMVRGCGKQTSLMLLGDADKALYRAKSNGRNQSQLYTTGLLGMAKVLRQH